MTRQAAAAVSLVLTALLAGNAHAAFADWWLTPDQQAQRAFEAGRYLEAARTFQHPFRKALAYYAAEEFATAASLFVDLEGPEARLYLGNSLANQDRLAEAAQAYREALILKPEFAEAQFNLEWIRGLLALAAKEYEDFGGTGGKLGADDVVVSDRADAAQSTVTEAELRREGVSDAQLEALWMRRVQTTPGDFLRLKFSYQLTQPSVPEEPPP